jgi:hypothetical protein
MVLLTAIGCETMRCVEDRGFEIDEGESAQEYRAREQYIDNEQRFRSGRPQTYQIIPR